MLQGITLKQRAKRSRTRPKLLAGDKGFDSQKIRSYLRARGIKSVIPEKKPRGKRRRKGRKPKFDKQLYKDRNIIERLINWLKDNRRLTTRYDKLARRHLAFVKLTFLKRYFKKLFSDTPYLVVWVPKYRYRVLTGIIKELMEKDIHTLYEW